MDLNGDGKIIGTIIISIVFFIALIIIIDEIYNITKFTYRYTYLYNYGKINENICSINNIEYEKARFRIYNEINNYKLEKDLFKLQKVIEENNITLIFGNELEIICSLEKILTNEIK